MTAPIKSIVTPREATDFVLDNDEHRQNFSALIALLRITEGKTSIDRLLSGLRLVTGRHVDNRYRRVYLLALSYAWPELLSKLRTRAS